MSDIDAQELYERLALLLAAGDIMEKHLPDNPPLACREALERWRFQRDKAKDLVWKYMPKHKAIREYNLKEDD